MIFLSGCAPSHNPFKDCYVDDAGFFMGMWHGFILPLTFIHEASGRGKCD